MISTFSLLFVFCKIKTRETKLEKQVRARERMTENEMFETNGLLETTDITVMKNIIS